MSNWWLASPWFSVPASIYIMFKEEEEVRLGHVVAYAFLAPLIVAAACFLALKWWIERLDSIVLWRRK